MTHKVRTLLLFCSLALFLSIIIVGPASATYKDAWADDMAYWGYRVPITITDAPTAAGVQRMITLTYQDEMQADFDDIRFYTASGDSIDYWIKEKTDSTSADVWVELPAADMLYIYVYYGNPFAESATNGSATFIFFDDFSDDLSQYNTGSKTYGKSEIITGQLKIYQSPSSYHWGAYVATKLKINKNTKILIEFSYSKPSGYDSNLRYSQSIYAVTDSPTATRETQYYYTPTSGAALLWKNPTNSASMIETTLQMDGLGNISVNNGGWTAIGNWEVVGSTYDIEFSNRDYRNYPCYFDNIIIRAYNAAMTSFVIGEIKQFSTYAMPYPGYDNHPRDLNGDGLYEDVNGNNRLDFQDIMIFFQYNAWAAAHQNNSYFDWSGNGVIEFSDVQLFWEKEFT